MVCSQKLDSPYVGINILYIPFTSLKTLESLRTSQLNCLANSSNYVHEEADLINILN